MKPKFKITIVGLAVLVFGACAAKSNRARDPREIRVYQGERLSSINDFRENSIRGPQKVDTATYRLEVRGLVDTPLVYRYGDVLKNFTSYRKVVTLHCVEGWDVKLLWEGVRLRDLFARAGVKPEATVVIFYSVDGYSTSLPLDYIIDKNIMLGCKMNGVTLPPERGFPFELVAEDKWGYKWAKWISAVELSADVGFRGFWDARGYNQNGDASGPMDEG